MTQNAWCFLHNTQTLAYHTVLWRSSLRACLAQFSILWRLVRALAVQIMTLSHSLAPLLVHHTNERQRMRHTTHSLRSIFNMTNLPPYRIVLLWQQWHHTRHWQRWRHLSKITRFSFSISLYNALFIYFLLTHFFTFFQFFFTTYFFIHTHFI